MTDIAIFLLGYAAGLSSAGAGIWVAMRLIPRRTTFIAPDPDGVIRSVRFTRTGER